VPQFGGFRGWSNFSGNSQTQWKSNVTFPYRIINTRATRCKVYACNIHVWKRTCLLDDKAHWQMSHMTTSHALQRGKNDRKKKEQAQILYRIYLSQRVTWLLYMGWLQIVGSLKLWVSFAEYRLFYRALLQKRPMFFRSLLNPKRDDILQKRLIILRSLLIVATP